MRVLVPRAKLLLHARGALIGQPKRVRGDCSCVDGKRTQGNRCLEVHYLGGGPLDSNPWLNDEPLEGFRYSLFADWDIHAKRYERLSAFFPGILSNGESIDLSEVL